MTAEGFRFKLWFNSDGRWNKSLIRASTTNIFIFGLAFISVAGTLFQESLPNNILKLTSEVGRAAKNYKYIEPKELPIYLIQIPPIKLVSPVGK